MEKRRHQRMGVSNLIVDISDGRGFLNGAIHDLSRDGIKLVDVSKRLDDASKQLSLVISDRDNHFKMMARPRWIKRQPVSKNVGLEIINAPVGWAEYVMDRESPSNDTLGEIVM